jgi:hypothetical protein
VGCLLSGVMFKHVPLFIQFFFYWNYWA